MPRVLRISEALAGLITWTWPLCTLAGAFLALAKRYFRTALVVRLAFISIFIKLNRQPRGRNIFQLGVPGCRAGQPARSLLSFGLPVLPQTLHRFFGALGRGVMRPLSIANSTGWIRSEKNIKMGSSD
jgi:hypothetical protein